MEHRIDEKRAAQRYPLEGKVTVLRQNGERFFASAVNISSSGMLLELPPCCPLEIGEEVTIDVQPPACPDEPFSTWGLATVVRRDDPHSAVHLAAGCFHGTPES
jgi:hypothetical protein